MAQWRNSESSFDDVHDNNEKLPQMRDMVEMAKYPDNEWLQVRTVGPVSSMRTHWLKFKTSLDGKSKGKIVDFGKPCLAYDRATGELDSTKHCPYCELPKEYSRASTEYFVNAIIRDLQEDEPAKKGQPSKAEAKTGFKEKGSKVWTPVRVARLPSGAAGQVKKLKELNKHKTAEGKKAYPISHAEYGCDIMINFDKDADGAKKYSIQKGDASPLTDDEQGYLLWDIQQDIPTEDAKEAKKEAARILASFEGEADNDDEDGDDEDDDTPKSKKKPAAKKKVVEDDDEDDFDDEDDEPVAKKSSKKASKPAADEDDFDDEDDEPVTKKKSAPAKKVSKDDDFEDEDEDDEPVQKKGAKKAPTKKIVDEDEDDFDDEDDAPAPKKGAKPASKKKVIEEDEEDFDDEDDEPAPKKSAKKKVVEDDDDDFDDDDEEPVAKKKGAPAKTPTKPVGKKKVVKEEDDDFDDEDEEPIAKKSAKKAAKPAVDDDFDDEDDEPAPKKSAKKKPVVDEDDDDFDD